MLCGPLLARPLSDPILSCYLNVSDYKSQRASQAAHSAAFLALRLFL